MRKKKKGGEQLSSCVRRLFSWAIDANCVVTLCVQYMSFYMLGMSGKARFFTISPKLVLYVGLKVSVSVSVSGG